MNDRDFRSSGNLHHAADVAGGDHVRLDPLDIRDLARTQPIRDVILKDVVGSR